MKSNILLFTAFLFLISINKKALASHAMGADLTYRCTGPGATPGSYIYEITYSFYRDCSGISAPLAPDLVVTNSCGYIVPTFNLQATINSPIQISPLCPTATSTCNGGAYLGIQEWIYTGSVTLPGPCHDWTFSHSESARNVAITTISNSGNLYVYSVLNNSDSICNNSPVFANRPVPFLCTGQQFCFNNGAFDIDGDSLSFQIITPRNGPSASDTVSFANGYSATQPLISNPPMSFNPTTGDFCANPIQADVTVLAILVKEYRNGVLIGQVERDLQLTVFACNNNLPAILGFNGSPLLNATVCINQQNCFFIRSYDADTGNTTSISWDHSIPNAIFTTLGGHRDTAIICWTPTSADTLSPYCFTVTVQDDNCPYLGIQTLTYCFTIDTSSACMPVQVKSIDHIYSSLKIYPQPASDNFTIDFGNDLNPKENYQLNIVNILGRTVFQTVISSQIMTINDLNRFSAGLHIAFIIDENGRILKSKKFAVMK